MTGQGRLTTASKLMKDYDWLTAKEMVAQHSLVVKWTMTRKCAPTCFNDKIEVLEDKTLKTTPARLLVTGQSYRWRTNDDWNRLPESIRGLMSLRRFKTDVRRWILDQRNDPG